MNPRHLTINPELFDRITKFCKRYCLVKKDFVEKGLKKYLDELEEELSKVNWN